MHRRLPALLVALLTALGTLTVVVPQGTADATQVHVRLRTAIKQLPVRPERPVGYDRDKFKHWVDADRDCHDTRDEVLAAESRSAVNAGCDVRHRQLVLVLRPGDLDAGLRRRHRPPRAAEGGVGLGAGRWTSETRERYANDLGDRRTLVAVTDNVNQSKSDRDPAEWLPTYGRCVYLAQWTAVKTRWSLSVDQAEKDTLTTLSKQCSNRWLTVSRAPITSSP